MQNLISSIFLTHDLCFVLQSVKDPLDPFGDENEDAKLAAIAKRMEEKYVSSTAVLITINIHSN